MDNLKLKNALGIVPFGFDIFPISWSVENEDGTYSCSCGDVSCVSHHGKHPLPGSHGFKDATGDLGVIKTAWGENPDANVGVRPKPNRVIIDIDRKNEDDEGNIIDGLTSLAEYMNISEAEVLQLTYTIKTPTGGFHLYYTCEDDDHFANRAGMLPGIDVRGHEGYVVGPGSMIRGKLYKGFNRSSINELPENLRELMNQTRERDEKSQETLQEWDHPTAVQYATTFLTKTKPAIEGHGGNDWTYQTICKVRDWAVSEDKCFELLMLPGGWNSRCEPSWAGAELLTIIENAYRFGKHRPGSKGGGQMFDGVELECEDVDLNEINPPMSGDPNDEFADITQNMYYGDAFSEQDRQYDFLVDEWIPARGFTCFLAQKSTGKTTVIVDLAMHVVNDMDWHGVPVDKGWSVLYLVAEDGEGVMDRMKAWKIKYGKEETPTNRLAVLEMNGPNGRVNFDFTDFEGVQRLGKFLKMRTKLGENTLIVCDTWQRLTAKAESQSNDGDMQMAVHNLEWLCHKSKGPAIIAAHPPKNNTSTVMGSSVIENSSQSIVVMDKLQGGIVSAKVDRIKGAREGSVLNLKFNVVNLNSFNKKGKERTSIVPEAKAAASASEVASSSSNSMAEQDAVLCSIIKGMLVESAMIWANDSKNKKQPSLAAIAAKIASIPDIINEDSMYLTWFNMMNEVGLGMSGVSKVESTRASYLPEYKNLIRFFGMQDDGNRGEYVSDDNTMVLSCERDGQTLRVFWNKILPVTGEVEDAPF